MDPMTAYGLTAVFKGPSDDDIIAPRLFALVERRRKADAVFSEVGPLIVVLR